MSKRGLIHAIGPTLAVLLFGGALWVLHQELRAYHVHEILQRARELSRQRVGLAVLLMVLGYLALTGYDALGLIYIRRTLIYPKIALTSFLAYAFSHNLGFAAVTGSAVRYRLYSGFGLSAVEIARVVALCAVTFWLGFVTLCGATFTVEPVVLPEALHLPAFSVRVIGILFLGILAAYLVWSVVGQPLRVRSWDFPPPTVWLSLGQIGISCVDWVLAAGVLFVLLPPDVRLSFPAFLSVFLLAQIVGLVSHVPSCGPAALPWHDRWPCSAGGTSRSYGLRGSGNRPTSCREPR